MIISLVAQVLGGLGQGFNSTAAMAILSSFENAERDQYIGWMEAAGGIGMLFGPLLGAFLYSQGGFMLPFVCFAGIYLLAYPYIGYILCKAYRIEKQLKSAGRSTTPR